MKTNGKIKGNTALERAVARWANGEAEGKRTAKEALDEVVKHGCQSGVVGELICYADTVKFYRRHAGEIDGLLAELIADTGESTDRLFGDKWNKEDPLARDVGNQNLLAWFAFEETARKLAERE